MLETRRRLAAQFDEVFSYLVEEYRPRIPEESVQTGEPCTFPVSFGCMHVTWENELLRVYHHSRMSGDVVWTFDLENGTRRGSALNPESAPEKNRELAEQLEAEGILPGLTMPQAAWCANLD